MTFPIEAVRQQFPSLATTDDSQRRIYFDNAAGTQVPRHTIDRIVDFFTVITATPVSLTQPLLRWMRSMTPPLPPWPTLGTPDAGEVLIGANMTTLTYQLSRSLAHQFDPGDEIIITRMEHEGNVSPGCRWLKTMIWS